MTKRLLEPVLDELLRYTNFANGRLLTAADLNTDRTAGRTIDQLLGRALGAGVVAGLEVSAQTGSTTVAITRGEAVTRTGQVLTLGANVDVQITAVPQGPAMHGLGGFKTCDDQPDLLFSAGAGVHLLVAAPASGPGGSAPANGPEDGRLGECVNQYVAEGIKFKLVPVNTAGLTVPGDRATLRNRAAYQLFGAARAVPHLFDATAGFGEVDPVRDRAAVSDDEVPLALLYFADNAIQFVDMWAARRRVVPSLSGVNQTGSSLWERLAGPERLALSEAMLQQFQAQMVELAGVSGALAMPARTWFDYLPPLGYLPQAVASPQTFFGSLPLQPINPDPAHLRFLVLRSALADPIPLISAEGSQSPAVGIYTSTSPAFTLFVRLDRDMLTVRETGQIEVTVTAADATDYSELQVMVTDAAGAHRDVVRRDLTLYRVDSLEIGKYQVELHAYGRPVGRKFCQIAVRGQKIQLAFNLPVSLRGGVPEEPAVELAAAWIPVWIEGPRLVKMLMLNRRSWMGGLPEKRDWRIIVEVPEWVTAALIRMGSWLLRHFPGATVDPAGIRLIGDQEFMRNSRDDRLYACAVFGDNTDPTVPLIPVVFTREEWTTPLPVPATKAKLAGFGRALYDAKLVPDRMGDLDVIAAAWPDLISELLTVETATAEVIIEEARAKTEEYRNALRTINGIGINLERALAGPGVYITNIALLAMADPDFVVEALGSNGMHITRAHAFYIVDQARRIAPRNQWAIDSPVVGLTAKEQSTVKELGVKTLGELHTKLADATAGPALIKRLGWNADTVKTVTEKITRISK